MVFLYTLVRFGRCEKGPDGLFWQHWPSSPSPSKVTLSYHPGGRVVISENDQPLERFDLCYGVGRHRLFYREATVLFFLDEKEAESRKSRVLFQSNRDCDHFRKLVEHHMPVEMIPDPDSEAPATLPPPLEVRADEEAEEEAEEEEGLELEPEAIDGLVRYCLLDPNFPALVTAVEKSLRAMLEEEKEKECCD